MTMSGYGLIQTIISKVSMKGVRIRMHWGQIKSLLILSFFILDIYLLVQFLEKKELSDIAIWEEQNSTIEEQLKNESITVQELPAEEYEESFISVKQQAFDEKELTSYKDNVKQETLIINKYLLVSELEEPIKIRKSATTDEL